MSPTAQVIRSSREKAAQRYRPDSVKLLLVAEAPPDAPDRYFYFEDVQTQDSLFRYVIKGLFNAVPTREKAPLLQGLQRSGVYLIDLKLNPVDGSPLMAEVPGLIQRCRAIAPDHIILIKANVYDTAFPALRQAGLPVVDARIPFPGSGQQKKFERAFSKALHQIGWGGGAGC